MCSSLLTTFVLSALIGNGNLEEKVEDLDGLWVPLSVDFGGYKFPDHALKTMKLRLKSGEYTLMIDRDKDTGTLEIDPSKSPRHMELIGTGGSIKNLKFPGIYEFDKDTLKLCFDLDGKERP